MKNRSKGPAEHLGPAEPRGRRHGGSRTETLIWWRQRTLACRGSTRRWRCLALHGRSRTRLALVCRACDAVPLHILSGLESAWCAGANDVANSFSTAVASKTLTHRQAVTIALFAEFTGAMVLGSSVTDTVRKKVVHTLGFLLLGRRAQARAAVLARHRRPALMLARCQSGLGCGQVRG